MSRRNEMRQRQSVSQVEDSDFSRNVYDICSQVPAGKVTTYKAIAEAMGSKAYRAVGNALNRNPHWPDVPCHRIVASDGGIGGFARGVTEKVKLLRNEGNIIEKRKVKNLKKYLWN